MKRSGLSFAFEFLNGIILGYIFDVIKYLILFDLLYKFELVIECDIGILVENCLETFASGFELV